MRSGGAETTVAEAMRPRRLGPQRDQVAIASLEAPAASVERSRERCLARRGDLHQLCNPHGEGRSSRLRNCGSRRTRNCNSGRFHRCRRGGANGGAYRGRAGAGQHRSEQCRCILPRMMACAGSDRRTSCGLPLFIFGPGIDRRPKSPSAPRENRTDRKSSGTRNASGRR